MGQEERRNKAKLEKTQISLATANTEYENAVKALEETTARWNREWKAAADKFQDLEEERLDFTKSSLWTFANIASTVCVSDDASCEKIRLSLEKTEVEKDIIHFITEQGTGQEIPDPPKYINFCRGDINDSQSEVSEDDSYSVAQFPRSINPAFRSSSPQPSTFESHHDPNSALANNLAHRELAPSTSREPTVTPQKPQPRRMTGGEQFSRGSPARQASHDVNPRGAMGGVSHDPYLRDAHPRQASHDVSTPGSMGVVPHDPYPMDGMTMLCRAAPASDLGSQPASARSSSRESHSEYSNPTSASSQELPSGKSSPSKHDQTPVFSSPEKRVFKKKSGFFQSHSPFRRKSTKEAQSPVLAGRTTWQASNALRAGRIVGSTLLCSSERGADDICRNERQVPSRLTQTQALHSGLVRTSFRSQRQRRRGTRREPQSPRLKKMTLSLLPWQNSKKSTWASNLLSGCPQTTTMASRLPFRGLRTEWLDRCPLPAVETRP